MSYLLSDLAALPHAAVVVEQGYGKVFQQPQGRGSTAAEAIAEAQARFPSVPIVFCETRALAQEWIYRWFGACLLEWRTARATADVEDTFATAPDAIAQLDRGFAGDTRAGPADQTSRGPSAAELRAWAKLQGLDVPDRGKIPNRVHRAWRASHEG